MTETGTEVRAEIRLPTQELRDDLPFYTKVLGFRLDMIFPADNPQVAVLSGHGLRLRIEKGATEAPATLRILTDDPGFAGGSKALTAPNGTRIEVDELNPPVVTPATEHAFVVRRLADQAPWVIGRAGMEQFKIRTHRRVKQLFGIHAPFKGCLSQLTARHGAGVADPA